MTSIKRVCLQVAVAGVVAGGGSAVATAVAHAEPSASDSTTSSATSAAAGTSKQSRGRVAKPAAAATTSSSSESAAATPRSSDRPRAAVRSRTAQGTPLSPSVTAPRSRATTPIPTAVVAEAQNAGPITVPDAAGAPAAAAPTVASAVATPAAPPAVVAVPAPAAPAPTPVPVPALPLLPALPVAPASAVTVNSSAATTRRTAFASATVQLVDTPTHVLLIGTDGTNLSKILEYTYDEPDSGFRAAMDGGVTGATSLVGHTTISGPSWSTILTGALDNKTGVINNLFNPAPYDAWPTVFNLIEYNKPAVNTAVVANWRYINDIADAGGYAADVNEFVEFRDTWEDTDDDVAASTIDLINATSGSESSFIFSYQVGVDEAGHLHGGGSPEYAAAVVNTSENIDAILDAIATWEDNNPGQQWTVIITTDHGHQQSTGLGHGFQSPNETSSFVIFDIEGDDTNDGKQNLAYTTADITPTIVEMFGIAQRSDFDGVPMQTKNTSIVDPGANLKQTLNDAIAMYGYPNIGTDIALGVRTVFASIPYFIDGFVTDISEQLQSIVDQDIFLISALAGLTELAVDFTGGLLVGVTQAIARVVATLTGSGVIAPNDPPLPAPPAAVLLDTAVLA
jgi:hypothetical protein